jgi:hypothetical protein
MNTLVRLQYNSKMLFEIQLKGQYAVAGRWDMINHIVYQRALFNRRIT